MSWPSVVETAAVPRLLRDIEGLLPGGAARSTGRLLEIIAALFECPTERAGWNLCLDIMSEGLGVESVAALEFVAHDRLVVRSIRQVDRLTRGRVLPVAPGSQAAYLRESGRVMVSGDLVTEERFEASSALTGSGFRSCLSAAFNLTDTLQGRPRTDEEPNDHNCHHVIFGAYSPLVDRFGPEETEVFASLVPVMASALRRLRLWEEMQLSARTDLLTGLMNRAAILQRLTDSLNSDSAPAAALIDLDGFKRVNDELGHRAGDSVLRTIAERIERTLSPGQTLGRLGGDEFLLVMDNGDAVNVAQRLVGHIEEVVMNDSRVIQLSAAIGIARARAGDDATSIIERADRLMYEAKSAGRGEIRVDPDAPRPLIEPTSSSTATGRPDARVTLDIVKFAIENLRIVVQPIVDPTTHHIHGVEALTRGPAGHPLEFPDRLFTVATTFGHLGELELASKKLAFDLELDEGVELFINLEPVLLCDETWLAALTRLWKDSRRPSVTVELTERAVLVSPGRLLQSVEVCRDLGWKIALDDVGSRSESLAALRWVDPDVVKLDMSLISNRNPAHTAHVVAAIAAYRDRERSAPVLVIAEGVETAMDAHCADVLSADLLQGYLFGQPSSLAELQSCENDLVSNVCPSPQRFGEYRVATKRELIAMTRRVESAALSSDCVLVASIQHVRNLTRSTRRQYEGIARRCGFVGLIGEGLATTGAIHGVRVADLAPDDPERHNWSVVALSPTDSAGLTATELEPNWQELGIPDMERQFSYRFIAGHSDVEVLARHLLRYF